MRALVWLTLAFTLAGCGDYSSGGRSSDDDAALLLLGGTAFLNGYNQPQSRPITCWNYGVMMQCQ